MSKIDGVKINLWVEKAKTRKPEYLRVSDHQWAESLDGYQEIFSDSVDENTTTNEFWSLIFFSAVAFCKGMAYQQELDGKLKPDFYPRY